jgi:hypothetical protein
MEHQSESGEQPGPLRRGLTDDQRQTGVELQTVDQRHEGFAHSASIVIEVDGRIPFAIEVNAVRVAERPRRVHVLGWHRPADSPQQTRVVAPDVGIYGPIIIGARAGRLSVHRDEPLKHAIVDQVLGHAREPSGLDVPRDVDRPVWDVNVTADDSVDLLLPAVVSFEPEGPCGVALRGVAPSGAKERHQLVGLVGELRELVARGEYLACGFDRGVLCGEPRERGLRLRLLALLAFLLSRQPFGHFPLPLLAQLVFDLGDRPECRAKHFGAPLPDVLNQAYPKPGLLRPSVVPLRLHLPSVAADGRGRRQHVSRERARVGVQPFGLDLDE